MKTVRMLFPQIVIEQKLIEVSDEQFERLVEDRIDVDKFIWENLTEQEQSWTEGQKWIYSYIENCGCGVSSYEFDRLLYCPQVCESCSKEFDINTMMKDDADNYFCEECWSELSPVMKSDYDQLVKNGEVEP